LTQKKSEKVSTGEEKKQIIRKRSRRMQVDLAGKKADPGKREKEDVAAER